MVRRVVIVGRSGLMRCNMTHDEVEGVGRTWKVTEGQRM